MKCSKCGFISFDHLAACKKCGTNLNQARNGLGFSDVKPEPPPFLKALVEQGGAAGPEDAAGEPNTMGGGVTMMAQDDSPVPAPARADSPSPGQADQPAFTIVDEQPDEWAMDSKWLEEFDKQPSADMPEVDDLILELTDDDVPPRAGAAHLEVPMDLNAGLPTLELHEDGSLDELVFDDFAPGGGEGLSLVGANDELDLFGHPSEKSAEPSKALSADLDDIVLELGDDTLDLADLELEESSL